MNRKIICFFLSVMMLCALSGCAKTKEIQNEKAVHGEGNTSDGTFENSPMNGNVPEPISIETGEGCFEEYSDSFGGSILRAVYPVVFLSDGDAEKYPELAKTFESINAEKRKVRKEMFDSFSKDIHDLYANKQGYFPYKTENRVSVLRADSVVVSLLFAGENYFGGVRSDLFHAAQCYDSKTGKQLTLDDVVVDKTVIPELVKQEVEKHWGEEKMVPELDWNSLTEEGTDVSWAIDNVGLTFYFNPNKLIINPSIRPVVTLSKAEHPELFKKKYSCNSESYGAEVVNDIPFFVDVENDGVADMVKFSFNDSMTAEKRLYSIMVNDKEINVETDGLGFRGRFIHTAKGKCLMLIETNIGYMSKTTCYELGGLITELGTVDAQMPAYFIDKDGEEIWMHSVLNNPESFSMVAYTSLLGTEHGVAQYHIGDSMVPEMVDIMYRFDEETPREFTLLKDLEVEIFDTEKRMVVERKVIYKDEKVLYYGTDDKEFAFLKLPDGSIARVKVECDSSGESVIDGTSIFDIFYMIIFAE